MAKKNNVDSVKVKMYRHGFGDCFLLSFCRDETCVFTMLIDCGIKFNTKSDTVPIENVIEDIKTTLAHTEGDKPFLDVLVATHEHWDHISYFHPTRGDNKDYFAGFEIGETWLAWTENPEDKEAKTINSRLRDGVAALTFAAEKLKTTEKMEVNQSASLHFGGKVANARVKFNHAIDDVMGFYGARSTKKVSERGIRYKKNGKISSLTQEAMENILKLGKGNGIKYLSPGTMVDKQSLPPGVNIYVLAPPSSRMINKSNPSRGDAHETYLSIDRFGMSSFIDGALAVGAAGNKTEYADNSSPFGPKEGITAKAAKSDDFFKKTYFSASEDYRKIENTWLDITGQFALQLDGAINNTSLVLAIELAESGKVLLFTGDAQVGSWLSWHDYKWTVVDENKSDSQNNTKTVTAEDLLNNTVLYKVSHHGSHNATVKAKGLEMMTHPELVAMIPEKEDSYHGILYQPLLHRLNQLCKGRVLISADVNFPPEKLFENRPPELSSVEWGSFKENLVVERTHIEFTVNTSTPPRRE
jgi:hypothetical protein